MRLQHLLIIIRLIHAEIREEFSALGDFAEESPAGGMILLMFLEMRSQKTDFLREDCDLHLRRTSVLGVGAMLRNQRSLRRALERHTGRR